jgi:LacI family repressor for deo operon, udp, cdd, tsx, nupC, and nupG
MNGQRGRTVTDPEPHVRPVTITDVAERAGVATSTVSRALTNPQRVNSVTRHRIEEAAKALGYVASSQARALASGKTGTVALLVPDITNPFYFGIIRGTQYQLKAAGYAQLLVDTEESAEAELDALSRLRSSVDGVVLVSARLSDAHIEAAGTTIPLVTINRAVGSVPSVVIDTPEGATQALQHLASLGHREVGFIAGPKTSWSSERRWRALEKAAPGLGVTMHHIGPFSPKTTSGAVAADSALNAGVTACIVFNDLMAIGMLRRLAERGIDVPKDMSIVGCDDIFGADFCNPALTTVTAPVEQAGRVATSMLLAQLRGPEAQTSPVPRVVLATHLTVRASSGVVSSRPAAPVGAVEVG